MKYETLLEKVLPNEDCLQTEFKKVHNTCLCNIRKQLQTSHNNTIIWKILLSPQLPWYTIETATEWRKQAALVFHPSPSRSSSTDLSMSWPISSSLEYIINLPPSSLLCLTIFSGKVHSASHKKSAQCTSLSGLFGHNTNIVLESMRWILKGSVQFLVLKPTSGKSETTDTDGFFHDHKQGLCRLMLRGEVLQTCNLSWFKCLPSFLCK